MFERDADSQTMKAYVNFVATYGRTYANMSDTHYRYRIFKENYETI